MRLIEAELRLHDERHSEVLLVVDVAPVRVGSRLLLVDIVHPDHVVARIGIVQTEVYPFPHRHKLHLMVDSRLQVGAAALVGEAVVVLLIAAQLTVRRSFRLLAVRHLYRPVALAPSYISVREEVVVLAADFLVAHAK